MAKRQTTFLIKRSNVPGKVPPISGLTIGELALNTADAKLYTIFTSGTTGATEVRQIGWDRINRTGDTVTGDFNFFGDITISGSSQPNGYALVVTGDTNLNGNTDQNGNFTITGNTTQSGDTFVTGNTSQVGNYNTTGNTTQYGNVYISGTSLSGQCAFEVEGNVCIDGDIRISGNTTQAGNTNQLGYLYIVSATTGCTFAVTGNTCLDGDVQVIGNLSYQGDLNVTGSTSLIDGTFISGSSLSGECALYVNGNVCIDGDVTISGDTFMSGDFCMNNMNSTGQTGTNCFDTSLIPTGDTVINQFQLKMPSADTQKKYQSIKKLQHKTQMEITW
jgi:cytoskeletal protein CcmA (bactofilin family)